MSFSMIVTAYDASITFQLSMSFLPTNGAACCTKFIVSLDFCLLLLYLLLVVFCLLRAALLCFTEFGYSKLIISTAAGWICA